jgi:heparanase 1
MRKTRYVGLGVSAALAVVGGVACSKAPRGAAAASIAPASMPRIGAIDERFQAYNVELVEVTGGRFWKFYSQVAEVPKTQRSAGQSGSNQPAGMNPDLYQYRPPIDLTKPRLRKLAAALSRQKWKTSQWRVARA